jgi:hypothetical protein
MDANQRKQGRINNTAAAISAGTLGDPSQDPNLPWHPTQTYVDAHNTDADGQRDAFHEAWVERARQETDDPYDWSQPNNHGWTNGEDDALLRADRGSAGDRVLDRGAGAGARGDRLSFRGVPRGLEVVL